ncbi:hypothetical protein M8J75_009740 [Diaphorina citri]|nr:hypothetical protein M8J75_009740 [Diaphorina citri]
MIKTNNNSIKFRNYNRKSRNRPSSLILTVNKNNNVVEVKNSNNDTVIIPRRYSENSLNTVPQNDEFLSDISAKNKSINSTDCNDQNKPDKIVKKDQSSQTSLEITNVSNIIKNFEDKQNTSVPTKIVRENLNNVSVRFKDKSNFKHPRNNNKRHSDHVPDVIHDATLPQYEEDTAISINNILDAINDSIINTDSDSDDEYEITLQNYRNPYYYVRTPNQSLVQNKSRNYTNYNTSTNYTTNTNYPLMKSKSDNTILSNDEPCSQMKSKDDIHISPENINIKDTDNTPNTNTKEPSQDQFHNPFDIFKNNSTPLNIGNSHYTQKTFKSSINRQKPNEVDKHPSEHEYKHKVSQETKANNQIDTNQSPLEENKAFLINNNNYIDNQVKVNQSEPEGSKYYCRMLVADTKTLPRTSTTASSLGTRLSVFRKSRTLTSKKKHTASPFSSGENNIAAHTTFAPDNVMTCGW